MKEKEKFKTITNKFNVFKHPRYCKRIDLLFKDFSCP